MSVVLNVASGGVWRPLLGQVVGPAGNTYALTVGGNVGLADVFNTASPTHYNEIYIDSAGLADAFVSARSTATLTLNDTMALTGSTSTALATLTAPTPPTITNIVAGDSQVTVSWTIPSSDGGSPITQYTVKVWQGPIIKNITPTGATSYSTTVTGLSNGVSYYATVTATNAIGSTTSANSKSVIPTSGGSTAWTGDPTAWDWAGNTGIRNFTALHTEYGSVTLTSTSQCDYQETRNGITYWVYDGHNIRNPQGSNPLGNPYSPTSSGLFIKIPNVIIKNVKAQAIGTLAVTGNSLPNIIIEYCETGIWDYFGGPQPTTDRYTGNPISQTAFRQFWWDRPNKTGYYIDPGGTWKYAGESWRYMDSATPSSPPVNSVWVQTGSNFDPIAYQRWNGSAWVDIAATVCPDVVMSTTWSPGVGGIWMASAVTCNPLTIQYNTLYGNTDTIFPIGGGATRVRYNWIRTNWTSRATYKPHGDMMQLQPGGSGWYVQRNFFDGELYYDQVVNPPPPYVGSEFSSAFFVKDANYSDILFTENWVRYNLNNVQIYASGGSGNVVVQNVRCRNNVFDNLTASVLKCLQSTGCTLAPIAWTNNRQEDGTPLPPGTRCPAAFTVDDGDPNGEGTTLK